MLGSTNLSSPSVGLAVERKSRTVEAFLAQRISKEQLCRLMETGPEQWEDTFTSLTAHGNDEAAETCTISPLRAVKELGLFQRLDELQDNSVWSPEERAIYRVVSHLSSPRTQNEKNTSAQDPRRFFQAALGQFNELDRNGDTFLDSGELDLAMSGGYFGERAEAANQPEAAAVMSTLRQKSALLAAADPNDGKDVSLRDLMRAQSGGSSQLELIADSVARTYEEVLDRVSKFDFSKTLQEESFEPLSIRQGAAGSCVFLSTVASLRKEDLQTMIQVQEDGSSQVTFADGLKETVSKLTLAERLYHTHAKDQESWPAVFEVAAAQCLYSESSEKYKSLREAIEGVSPEDAIRLLSGQGTDRRSLDELSVEGTRQALVELGAYGGPMICGSRPSALGDFISVEDLHNGIVNSHAYTILNFDAESDTVTLRNPWGHKEWVHQQSPDDGIFEMPLKDFYSSFRWIAAANGRPAA